MAKWLSRGNTSHLLHLLLRVPVSLLEVENTATFSFLHDTNAARNFAIYSKRSIEREDNLFEEAAQSSQKGIYVMHAEASDIFRPTLLLLC
jgi:hypothetical protein